MTRWEKEGINYRRVIDWTSAPHGDQFIRVSTVLGDRVIRLFYEDGVVEIREPCDESRVSRPLAYFPIEELEEIVNHMKNTIKRRRKQFEESTK